MTTVLAPPPPPILSPPATPTPIQQMSPQPYTSQAQFTPPSSSETPQSPISPRSALAVPPHLQFQTRQIRQPKSPMYVPAVLRPTEKPARHSPPKNKTSFGSFDSGVDVGSIERPEGVAPGLSRIVTEEWNEEVLGPVTGMPSKNHWKPDTASPKCDDPSCEKTFTWLNRRHHCRRCGRIYCSDHSSHYVPLDQHARFHPQASKHRACNPCWSDYGTWEVARVSRSNSTNSRDSTTPPTQSVPFAGRGKPNDGFKPGSQAASVPRDWNWSTF